MFIFREFGWTIGRIVFVFIYLWDDQGTKARGKEGKRCARAYPVAGPRSFDFPWEVP
jgi:hypothetical protein